MSTYVLRTEFPTTEQVAAVRAQYTNAESLMKALAATRKAVGEAATGTASSKAQNDIAVMEEALRADASFWLKSLAWHQEMHAAGVAYRKNSPTIEDRTAAESDVRAKLTTMKETGKALGDAEKVLSSARGMLMGASEEGRAQAERNVAVAEMARDTAKVAADKAAAEYRVAKAYLADVNRRMKAAEEAYSTAVGRAKVPDVAVSGNGYGVGGSPESGTGDPGASTAGVPSKPGGPSKPAPSTATAGAPAAKPGGTPAGAAKPGGTTAAPAGATPAAKTTETDSSTSGKDLAGLLAGLRAQGQTSQTGQQQPASAAPAAAAPSTGAGTGKPGQGEDGKGGQGGGSGLGRPWDLPDVAAAVGTSVDWLNGKPAPAAAPTTTPAPAAPAANPAARLAGGVPTAPTSGTSVTGVSTSQDVSGRSAPAATAYSPAPGGPSTSTSAAHGGAGAGSSTAGGQAGRTGMGTGMPIMPMVPAAGGGAGGPSGDRKTVTRFRRSDEVDILNGELTLSEAVGGYGTLCRKTD